MKQCNYLILGAGISGLAAANHLQAKGKNYILLDAAPKAGGLTRTIQIDQFCFDYTGHFLHLSQFQDPANIPYAKQSLQHWQQIPRKSYVFYKNHLVTAPIQYHLGELPAAIKKQFLVSYQTRTDTSAKNFNEYLTTGFGNELAKKILIPQNEKTWAIQLEKLGIHAASRFFPAPNEALIQAGLAKEKTSAQTYNSLFWYPKVGGIELLTQGLAQDLTQLHSLQHIIQINLKDKIVTTSSGETWQYQYLLCSLPLKTLCALTNQQKLTSNSSKLSNSTTLVFNIGLNKTLPKKFKDAHWIYFPEKQFPFYRVGFYSNISPKMCPDGNTALYAEYAYSSHLPLRQDPQQLETKIINGLEQLGILKKKDIACKLIHKIPCAYVHHTHQREKLTTEILTYLHQNQVYPMGRYGLWDYTSMEDSIKSGIQTVDQLL